MAQYTGKVAWFNNAKGYGFLTREGGPYVFVHYSLIQLDCYKGLAVVDDVEFDVIQGDKGLQADKVVPALANRDATTLAPQLHVPFSSTPSARLIHEVFRFLIDDSFTSL